MFKLVLIDDDAEVLAINQKYLTGAGFTVYTAISPREGVLSIRKNLPDCILLDVMLPEADGYRVCRYIRSFSSVPILFLTARSSEEDVIRGRLSGQTLQSPGAESPGGPPDPQAQTTGAGFFRSGTDDRKSFHRQGSPQGLLPGTGSVSRQPGI